MPDDVRTRLPRWPRHRHRALSLGHSLQAQIPQHRVVPMTNPPPPHPISPVTDSPSAQRRDCPNPSSCFGSNSCAWGCHGPDVKAEAALVDIRDNFDRLASALRESRARAEQIGKDRAIAWSEANGLTEHHYAVVEPELASLRARVEAAERDLADIRKICEEHGITDRIAGMECTVVGMVGKLAGLCSLRHEQREVTRRLLAEATSCIAQLEQSLALSEDKVKALRQEIEALYKDVKHESAHEEGWNDAIDAVTALLSSPTPTPTTANPAASLIQQGDPK